MLSTAIAAAIFLPGFGACGGGSSSGGGAASAARLDEEAPVQALGWLGGRAHPAARAIQVPEDGGGTRAVGGMVVTEVQPGGALAAAGVARGDVLVRVDETWLPNKEDPGADLVRMIEAQVSAGANPVAIAYWRDGEVTDAELAHDHPPLEVGLPGPSERLARMTEAGLARLVALQAEDGSFGGATATTALAGLALLAGGAAGADSGYAEVLDRCYAVIQAAVADEESVLDPWSASFSTMLLAEVAGPLEIEMPSFTTIASSGVVPSEGMAFDFSEGLPEGAVVFEAGDELPPEIQDMIDNLDLSGAGEGGDVSVSFMVAGPDGAATSTEPPEGFELPELEPATGPLWEMEGLSKLAGEDLAPRLEILTLAVERLVSLQGETGGWDPEDAGLGYSDATLATNQALFALGMAERAGAPVDSTVLRRGIEFVRAHTNDGHVFSTDSPGFDRRREAGRANGAAAALTMLGCASTDEFLRELVSYGEQHAKTIPDAGAAVPLHVLETAILRRQQGLGPWAVFFEEFKHVLVAQQDPDGSFAPWPGESSLAVDAWLADEAARTALWSLVAGLQSDRTPVLLAQARNPLQTPIDGQGIRHEGGVFTFGDSMPLEDGALQDLLEAAGQGGDGVIWTTGDDDGE
jgi:hypothetical protein